MLGRLTDSPPSPSPAVALDDIEALPLFDVTSHIVFALGRQQCVFVTAPAPRPSSPSHARPTVQCNGRVGGRCPAYGEPRPDHDRPEASQAGALLTLPRAPLPHGARVTDAGVGGRRLPRTGAPSCLRRSRRRGRASLPPMPTERRPLRRRFRPEPHSGTRRTETVGSRMRRGAPCADSCRPNSTPYTTTLSPPPSRPREMESGKKLEIVRPAAFMARGRRERAR